MQVRNGRAPAVPSLAARTSQGEEDMPKGGTLSCGSAAARRRAGRFAGGALPAAVFTIFFFFFLGFLTAFLPGAFAAGAAAVAGGFAAGAAGVLAGFATGARTCLSAGAAVAGGGGTPQMPSAFLTKPALQRRQASLGPQSAQLAEVGWPAGQVLPHCRQERKKGWGSAEGSVGGGIWRAQTGGNQTGVDRQRQPAAVRRAPARPHLFGGGVQHDGGARDKHGADVAGGARGAVAGGAPVVAGGHLAAGAQHVVGELAGDVANVLVLADDKVHGPRPPAILQRGAALVAAPELGGGLPQHCSKGVKGRDAGGGQRHAASARQQSRQAGRQLCGCSHPRRHALPVKCPTGTLGSRVDCVSQL